MDGYDFTMTEDEEGFFTPLSKDQVRNLNQKSTTIELKKGRPVFIEGDDPVGLLYLKKGGIKVYKNGAGQREQIVRLVKPNSFLGYKALFAEKKHTTSAETIENSEIIIYNKTELFTIIDNNPQFSRKIIVALANELAFNYKRLINLTQKHIRGRLAETIVFIKDIYGYEEDGKTLKAKFTRENLAHFSNMTTSNAIRTLKVFCNEGVINTEGRRIIIENEELLYTISQT